MNPQVWRDLIGAIQKVSWVWDLKEWPTIEQMLHLREVRRTSRGVYGRIDYVTALGFEAWAQLNRENIVSLNFEVIREDGSRCRSEADHESLLHRFDEYFSENSQLIRTILGAEVFSGGVDVPGFPDDVSADRIALWRLPTARLMLELLHAGRATPLSLTITVAPLAAPSFAS